MIVYSPGLFIHLLDIGPSHEPCCHIALPDVSDNRGTRLCALTERHVPIEPTSTNTRTTSQIKTINGAVTLNLVEMHMVKLEVSPQFLIDAYKRDDMVLSNRLAILHYFMLHLCDMNTVAEVSSSLLYNSHIIIVFSLDMFIIKYSTNQKRVLDLHTILK